MVLFVAIYVTCWCQIEIIRLQNLCKVYPIIWVQTFGMLFYHGYVDSLSLIP